RVDDAPVRARHRRVQLVLREVLCHGEQLARSPGVVAECVDQAVVHGRTPPYRKPSSPAGVALPVCGGVRDFARVAEVVVEVEGELFDLRSQLEWFKPTLGDGLGAEQGTQDVAGNRAGTVTV